MPNRLCFVLAYFQRSPILIITKGYGPPIHNPLALEAASLSRIRSAVTSRSNWAKDSSMFKVSRPMEVALLKDWVTDTKEAPAASSFSTNFEKSVREPVKRSTL